jgi:hypothetical protein
MLPRRAERDGRGRNTTEASDPQQITQSCRVPLVPSWSRSRLGGQIVQETLENKNRAGGMTQGEGPEFKPQFHRK